MARVVIDASVASGWCFKDEATEFTDAVLEAAAEASTLIAPKLWAYEIRNSILMGLRRGRLTKNDAEEFLNSLSDLNITLFDPVSFDHLFLLAGKHKLTVYDAAYLELAIRETTAIATLDKDLVQAATEAGISLFKP